MERNKKRVVPDILCIFAENYLQTTIYANNNKKDRNTSLYGWAY